MNTIKLSEKNYIHYCDTKWNNKVLGVKTNEIYQINFDSINNGKILLEEFEKICSLNVVDYSLVRIAANEREKKNILENYGYNNLETSLKVTNNFKNIKNNDILNKFSIQISSPNNNKHKLEIKEIAYNDFHFGRFFEDTKIEDNKARVRNSNWIDHLYKNSSILAGFYKNQLIGFMAYSECDLDIKLELGGVSSKFNYLAYPFWNNLFNLFGQNNFNSIQTIISASNVGIINLYSHFGFKFRDSYFSYRKIRNQNK